MTKYTKTMSEAYEQVLLGEDNMDLMKKAAGGAMQTLKMKDGKLKMDSFTASAIMQIYKAVNDKNKKTMENLVNTGNKAAILKLQKFAMSKINSGDELEHDGEELDEEVSVKDFDALKKGDTITVEYKSAMSSGKGTFTVTAKNKVAKGKVEKVTLKNVKNPGGVKNFLYKRDDKVSFAQGDMGASVVGFKKEEVELDEVFDFVLLDKDNKIVGRHSGKDAKKNAEFQKKSAHLAPMSASKSDVKKMKIVPIAPKDKKDIGDTVLAIGEDMTVTGSTDGSISQRDLDHVQKELRRLGIKDAVVDQNEMDKNKIDVQTKMSDDKVKKAFNKSKMTVTYEHVQMEGTWGAASTPKEKNQLKKYLSKPFKAKDYEKLYDLIGDDGAFDDFGEYAKKNPNADLRPMMRDWMYELGIFVKEETESLEETVMNIMNEGKMSEIDAMRKDGKSAEEIAKAMKMPVKSIKKILGEASARADAMRAMRQGKKVDPADVDTDATDDDVKAASKNIIMQMRKVISLRGNFKVEFGDKKKMKIDPKIAVAVQNKYDSMKKADDKEKFQAKVTKSYKDMLSALKESLAEAPKKKKEKKTQNSDAMKKVKNDKFSDRIKNARATVRATKRGTQAHDDALDSLDKAKKAQSDFKKKTASGKVKSAIKKVAVGAAVGALATAKLGDSFDPTIKREAILDRIDKKLQEKKNG